MKPWTVAAVAAGLVATTTASAKLVEFNEQLLALSSSGKGRRHPRPHLKFNALETEPLSSSTLQLVDGYYGGSERIPCTSENVTTNSGMATVVLAISKCLNASAIEVVKDWIKEVEATNLLLNDNGEQRSVQFTTTLIPGQCQAYSERANAGRHDDGIGNSRPAPPEFLLSDGTDYRSSQDVLPGEVARIQAFAAFGRVLESPQALGPDEPVAVVSFVNNEKSYEYITEYEAKYKVSKTFNFQLCADGVSCEGRFENCVFLPETVDLYMYNPFAVARTFMCAALDGGIPVSYVNERGERECFCACPVGTELQEVGYGGHACVEVETDACPCAWNLHPFGFKLENTQKVDTCAFAGLATNWTVPAPVPFPLDNYVADNRNNSNDPPSYAALADGPRVDVVLTPLNSPCYVYDGYVTLYERYHTGALLPDLPPARQEVLNNLGLGELPDACADKPPRGVESRTHYTWKDYQQHRLQKIDDVQVPGYGKFELAVEAFDYVGDAKCVGCVAVVDHFRPKHTTACPASFCDNTTSLCAAGGETAVAELNVDTLDRASTLVADFYDFIDKAENDACSAERCDVEVFEFQDFFEAAPSDHGKAFRDGKTCFSDMEADFAKSAQATTNPLARADGAASQRPQPVAPNQCMRCCSYETQLRETWVDYACGYDYDMKRCDGDATERCRFKQCLLVTGDMVVDAKASIKDAVQEASTQVIEGLPPLGYQPYTQIHRALACADFAAGGSDCRFEAAVADLLDVAATNKFGGADNTYAFWRFRVEASGEDARDDGGAPWRLWSDATEPITFAAAETKITLEAWTACGRARTFFFYVHLHLHTDIHVCDEFPTMWYQTSRSRVALADKLCAYPGSDFAELTFDYVPNVGLRHSRNALKLQIASVSCALNYTAREPVPILNVTHGSFEIVERFAVELQNQDATARDTTFDVACTFTYAGAPGGKHVHKTCPLSFTITDCNGPSIDVPGGECAWDSCAGNALPGPFEACGGNVVRATATAAYLTTDETECCDACKGKTTLVCTPILGLPDESRDIKRCVPGVTHGGAYEETAYGNYDDHYGGGGYGDGGHGGHYGGGHYGDNDGYGDSGYYVQAAVFMAKAVAAHPAAAAATALLAASAMVALVALVVVRRRRALAAEAAVVVEDAYYPLLH